MAVSGETIDFGPCAFMDAYEPAKVFSSIDRLGRYAYGNQPQAAAWNLARLAETLLPLLDAVPQRAVELATEEIGAFAPQFSEFWLAGLRRKLGLSTAEEGDAALADALLAAMHHNQADFTQTFRGLCDAASGAGADAQVRVLFASPQAYDEWAGRWRARLARDPVPPELRRAAMKSVNPAVIPRNHRIEQVIDAAVDGGDFAPFMEMSEALAEPFRSQERFASYALPPLPEQRVLQTFCGT
jgi:uncharacterized protein YdiU (UPF0061 family)